MQQQMRIQTHNMFNFVMTYIHDYTYIWHFEKQLKENCLMMRNANVFTSV